MTAKCKTNQHGRWRLRATPGFDDRATWDANGPEHLRRFFTDELGRRWEVQIHGDSPDPNYRAVNFFVYRERNGPPVYHAGWPLLWFVWFCDRFKRPAGEPCGGNSGVALAWHHYEDALAWAYEVFPGQICWRKACPSGCTVPEEEAFLGRGDLEFLALFRDSEEWCAGCFAYNCLTAARILCVGFWRAMMNLNDEERRVFARNYGILPEEEILPARRRR